MLVQVDTDGRTLLTAGPAGRDDPRLRRSQAAAANAPVNVDIARALLRAKIDGQASIAGGHPDNTVAAATLAELSHPRRPPCHRTA